MKKFVKFKILQFLLCVANGTLSLIRLHSPPTLATATGKCHPFVAVIRVKLILSIPKNRNGFFLWLHRPMPTNQPVGQAVSYHTALPHHITPHRTDDQPAQLDVVLPLSWAVCIGWTNLSNEPNAFAVNCCRWPSDTHEAAFTMHTNQIDDGMHDVHDMQQQQQHCHILQQ